MQQDPKLQSQQSSHIDSVQHSTARRLRDVLKSKAERPRTIIIDDLENIEQAAKAGVAVATVFVVAPAATSGAQLKELRPAIGKALAAAAATAVAPEIVTIEPAVVKALFAADKHVRVFALAAAPKAPKLSAMSAFPGDIVVLDGVRIVGNIGAIVRTACALGAAGVVLLDSGLQSIYDRRLVRASRGLVFSLPVVTATPAQLQNFINTQGLAVAALDIRATEELAAIRNVTERLAIVLGSEREGASEQLQNMADYKYLVPMDERVESLNVSVTAGLALYLRSLRGI